MSEPVEGGLKSVAAALDLLDLFTVDEELGVTEIGQRLGVAKSTAHRLLTTLVSRGLVEQSRTSGRYRLGVHLFELGHLALSRIELREKSKGLLEELREASGWTVHLGIASGADVLFLERLSTVRGMRVIEEYRRRWPLHATASGKALCAFDPVAAQARAAAGLPAFTPRTITDPAHFARELAEVRRRGYAQSDGELMARLGSVAAPVLNVSGVAIAAISIAGSADDFAAHADRQVRLVTTAATRLGRQLNRTASERR